PLAEVDIRRADELPAQLRSEGIRGDRVVTAVDQLEPLVLSWGLDLDLDVVPDNLADQGKELSESERMMPRQHDLLVRILRCEHVDTQLGGICNVDVFAQLVTRPVGDDAPLLERLA